LICSPLLGSYPSKDRCTRSSGEYARGVELRKSAAASPLLAPPSLARAVASDRRFVDAGGGEVIPTLPGGRETGAACRVAHVHVLHEVSCSHSRALVSTSTLGGGPTPGRPLASRVSRAARHGELFSRPRWRRARPAADHAQFAAIRHEPDVTGARPGGGDRQHHQADDP